MSYLGPPRDSLGFPKSLLKNDHYGTGCGFGKPKDDSQMQNMCCRFAFKSTAAPLAREQNTKMPNTKVRSYFGGSVAPLPTWSHKSGPPAEGREGRVSHAICAPTWGHTRWGCPPVQVTTRTLVPV